MSSDIESIGNDVVVSCAGRVVFNPNLTKTENRLDVLRNASRDVQLAFVAHKGAIGKAAREMSAPMGVDRVIERASSGDYRGVAEWFAVELGIPVVVSNRASFESLPDRMEGKVLEAKARKNGGMVERNGVVAPGPMLKAALEAHAAACWMVARAREVAEERAAKRATDAATEERAAALKAHAELWMAARARDIAEASANEASA